MLAHVLYFQFAFMYLLALVMGLVVYGSDFDSITGWLYVTPLIVLAVFHKQVWPRRFKLISQNKVRAISFIAVIAALFAYTPLHMSYWDEHSISQAVWIALLGVCSYFISVIGAVQINAENASCRYCAPGALALIGVFWLFSLYFPMIVLLFLGLLFVVSLMWFNPVQPNLMGNPAESSQTDIIAKYAVFMLAIDIGCIIWDYQVNSAWGLYVGAVFMAGAVGFYVKLADDSEKFEQTVYILAIGNFILAAIWPAFILWSLHALVAGLCMGYLLPRAISRSGYKEGPRVTLGWTAWVFIGLALSNAWYANLQWAFTRLIVVLPFAVLGIFYLKYRFAALKHQA